MSQGQLLHDWLRDAQNLPAALAPERQALAQSVVAVIPSLMQACAQISEAIGLGGLTGLTGDVLDGVNVQGEQQKPLDVLADQAMARALQACPTVAGWVSEERDTVSCGAGTEGHLLVCFDPLDGSSNIDANISVGTIFSVMAHPQPGRAPQPEDFFQAGHALLAAGYVVYGPATVLTLSLGAGLAMFALDRRDGQWKLVREQVRIAASTREFAINSSNQRYWEQPVQRYIGECLAGDDGPRAKHFNMRWVASMVAEVHRILTRGGVFLYPRDQREGYQSGRLRLLYEAQPMAFLIEQAGGAASTGQRALLDVQPTGLHQRVPVLLGARDEIDRLCRYYDEPEQVSGWQLFKNRSLFVQTQV